MTGFKAALQWLERETENTPFGVIGLSIVVHAGKIKRIERSITQKEQIEEANK
jgi:hypothetical protein